MRAAAAFESGGLSRQQAAMIELAMPSGAGAAQWTRQQQFLNDPTTNRTGEGE
jgi:hypothetical protein